MTDDYLVGDDGNIYRRLKSSYYRSRRYPYQMVRQKFGTNKEYTVKVHQAVALAFCSRPEGKTEVDHIDGNKQNNSAVNLRWVSHIENLRNKKGVKNG